MMDTPLFNTEDVLQLLTPEQIGPDRYRCQSHFMGSPNVFGGQVVGQALGAATLTVENRQPHSLHSLFLLPGNYHLPIEYEVERVRDGSSFSTRRVVAFQEGRRIFVTSVSFQVKEEGFSHQKTAPVSGDPESLPSSAMAWKTGAEKIGRSFQGVPVDFRTGQSESIYTGQVKIPSKHLWIKAPIRLGDDASTHEALFAYVSDYGLLWTSVQPHGVSFGDPRLQIASLDHTIWFHRPFRMDDWLLVAMESPNAAGGRGFSMAHVYDRGGVLVATLAQEGLIRLRDG